MKDKKYFTNPPKIYGLITRWGIYVCLLYLITPDTFLTMMSICMFALLELYFIAIYWTYPELNDTSLVHRNLLFRFYSRTYAYSDIESLEISGSSYHYPLLILKLKNKSIKRCHSVDCMSRDSIEEFVVELQKHGVTVIR